MVLAASAKGAEAIIAPELGVAAEPTYPDAMRERNVGGTVVVALTVGVDGKVGDVKVVDSAGPDFDAAAMEAAARLHFAPGSRAGKAIPLRIRYRFVFSPDTTEVRRAAAKSDGRFDRRDAERNPAGFSSLRGTLREKGTGRPVAGALLLIDGGPEDALTNRSGEFAS